MLLLVVVFLVQVLVRVDEFHRAVEDLADHGKWHFTVFQQQETGKRENVVLDAGVVMSGASDDLRLGVELHPEVDDLGPMGDGSTDVGFAASGREGSVAFLDL